MIKIIRNIQTLTANFSYNIVNTISVYEGISPSLLATMSLSQGVKGNTNEELINSLVKSNIIRNKTLQTVMKRIDRKHFISEGLRKSSAYYQNRPYKISGGQNMTDIFTHAVVLEEACFHLDQLIGDKQKGQQRDLRILDIGTGHGYLAYIISSFINQMMRAKNVNLNYKVVGIDLNKNAIQYSQSLKEKLSYGQQKFQRVIFSHQDIEERLEHQQPYDIIIGGFYMPPSLHEKLLLKLEHSLKKTNRKKHGIWAADSSSGQSLYTFSFKEQNEGGKMVKSQIMSTMFSMPVVKTGVSKYFIEDGQDVEKEEHNKQVQSINNSQQINESEQREKLKGLKIQRKKEQKQKLKQELKQKIIYYSKKMNKKLSLDQMKKIEEINSIIQKLNQK